MTTNYAPVFPFILFKSNHFHFHLEYDIIENDDLSVYGQVNMWSPTLTTLFLSPCPLFSLRTNQSFIRFAFKIIYIRVPVKSIINLITSNLQIDVLLIIERQFEYSVMR